MKRSLAWLWLIGAVLYAVSTWLSADAVSVVGRNGENSISSSTTSPSPLSVARVSEEAGDVAETRTESPAPAAPLALGLPADAAKEVDEPQKSGASDATSSAIEAERFVVRSAANIRNGPSSKSTLIGTAPGGAELKVAEREGGWVRFVDPATSNTGWIYEGLLTPLGAEARVERPITTSVGDAVKPKAKVHTRNVARSVVSGRVGGHPAHLGHAQLPPDEDLRPNKRRLGLFARRRMLREGLLSEDFTPPR